MRAHASEVLRAVVWLAAVVALGACRETLTELEVVERRALIGAEFTTLHVASDGGIWLGWAGGFLVHDDDGAITAEVPVDAAPAPVVVAALGDAIVARTAGDSIALLRTGVDTHPMVFVAGEPFPDVRSRWLFIGARSGAVLIYEPDSLVLVSAWGSLDAPTTALTGSPEGDRLYQALEMDGGTILTRDVQTGRVLRTSLFAAPFHQLLADRAGNLFGVIGEGRDAAVISLRPWGPELELRWRERVPAAARDTRIRLSPAGDRLAVISGGGNEKGLRVLDAETGTTLGHLPDPPLDAAFDPAGRLLLLYPGELRVVR
jgi:hypothetical protein